MLSDSFVFCVCVADIFDSNHYSVYARQSQQEIITILILILELEKEDSPFYKNKMHLLFITLFSFLGKAPVCLSCSDFNTKETLKDISIFQNQFCHLQPPSLMSVEDTDEVTKVKYCSCSCG